MDKVLQLHQSLWFKTYTDFNTKKNVKDILSSFGAFGKTKGILKKKVDVKLVKNDPGHKKICG